VGQRRPHGGRVLLGARSQHPGQRVSLRGQPRLRAAASSVTSFSNAGMRSLVLHPGRRR
jgi:hypothetical protein